MQTARERGREGGKEGKEKEYQRHVN